MTTETESTGIVIFDELQAGISVMKGKYKDLPDVTTKEGYNTIKANCKEGRSTLKKLEDARMEEKRKYIEAGKKLDLKAGELKEVIEEVFKPHFDARKAEDKRLAKVKQEKQEAAEKRESEIKDRLDLMRRYYVEAMNVHSNGVTELIAELETFFVNEESFGSFLAEAEALKPVIQERLQALYESKLQQETAAEKIAEQQRQLDDQKEQQRQEDEERAVKQRKEQAAESKRIKEENDKLKAENDRMAADRKKLDDEKATLEAEKQKIKDAEDQRVRDEENRKAEEIRLEKERAANVKREAKEKKDREAAEKKAKEEGQTRFQELLLSISSQFWSNEEGEAEYQYLEQLEAFIISIENKKIPYLRLNWTEK